MKIRSTRAIAAGLVAALVLGGCGNDGPSSAADTVADEPDADEPAGDEPAGDEPEADAAFPVTVSGDNGEVTITERPDRIIVLSASLTEIVFAVGAGDQVIAVDSYSDFPDGTPMTDLSAFRPNIEAIGAYEPDLVLLARDSDGVVASLAGVGIASLVLSSAAHLDEVYAQIDTIGAATGHAEAATALAASLASEIDAELERAAGQGVGETYFYEMGDDYRTHTSDTFVGSIFAALGLVNIADDVDPAAGAYPQLSAEFVLGENPDRIFVAHTDGSEPTLDELADRPGWDTLDTIVDGKVTYLDVDVASRWGPRITDVVTSIVDALVDDPTP